MGHPRRLERHLHNFTRLLPSLRNRPSRSKVITNRFRAYVSPHLESLWTDQVAVSANCLYSFTSADGVHLFQNSMNMISHRKLREIEVKSDFLICETLGDESNQLLLAQS